MFTYFGSRAAYFLRLSQRACGLAFSYVPLLVHGLGLFFLSWAYSSARRCWYGWRCWRLIFPGNNIRINEIIIKCPGRICFLIFRYQKSNFFHSGRAHKTSQPLRLSKVIQVCASNVYTFSYVLLTPLASKPMPEIFPTSAAKTNSKSPYKAG